MGVQLVPALRQEAACPQSMQGGHGFPRCGHSSRPGSRASPGSIPASAPGCSTQMLPSQADCIPPSSHRPDPATDLSATHHKSKALQCLPGGRLERPTSAHRLLESLHSLLQAHRLPPAGTQEPEAGRQAAWTAPFLGGRRSFRLSLGAFLAPRGRGHLGVERGGL